MAIRLRNNVPNIATHFYVAKSVTKGKKTIRMSGEWVFIKEGKVIPASRVVEHEEFEVPWKKEIQQQCDDSLVERECLL